MTISILIVYSKITLNDSNPKESWQQGSATFAKMNFDVDYAGILNLSAKIMATLL